MIKNLFLSIVVFTISLQITTAQSINEIINISWNRTNGLPYIPEVSGNYSVDVFTQLNKNEYAFLSKAEKKILVFDINTNQKLKEISLSFFPIDFSFSDNKYYLQLPGDYMLTYARVFDVFYLYVF